MNKAVIYARVSTGRQARERTIDSQLDMCRKYADGHGLDIVLEFKDDGLSGADEGRPELNKMLGWIKKNPGTTVIYYDTSRQARHAGLSISIKDRIINAGCIPAFLSFNYENTPEGNLVFNMQAATDQYQRDSNKRKVCDAMLAHMQSGIWLLQVPIGLKRGRDGNRRVIITRDEPAATIISEAIEKFASGQLSTKQDVADFLSSRLSRNINRDYARRLVENPVYTGYFDYPKWNIPAQKWNIEPVISLDLHRRVMEKIQGIGRASPASNIMSDFPLRGYVLCGHCGKALTSCWSKGKNKKHPYYMCYNKDCVAYGKSIRRDEIENQMSDILKSIRADDNIMALVELIIDDVAKKKKIEAVERNKELRGKISQLDKEISSMVDLIAKKGDDPIARHFESKLRELDEERGKKSRELEDTNTILPEYRAAFEKTREFIRTPYKLFENGGIEQKQKVLKLVFRDKPRYLHGQGFRTPSTMQIFNLSGDFKPENINWWS